MQRRLFAYLSIVMMALLPLQTNFAATGSFPMGTEAPIAADMNDCTGDPDNEHLQCVSDCLALCHALPIAGAALSDLLDELPLKAPPLNVSMLLAALNGPEPPPPRPHQ